MNKATWHWAVPILLMCSTACTRGALVQTDFNTPCANGTCTSQPLNAPLAQGAFMDLDVSIQLNTASTPPPTLLRAGDQDVLRTDGRRVLGVGPGLSALLVQTPDGVVVDFFHIWVGAVSNLQVTAADAQGTALPPAQMGVTLHVGEEVTLTVTPFANSQQLLGRFPLEVLTDSGAAVATVDANANRVFLTGVTAGTVQVSLNALEQTSTFTVVVLP